MKNTLMIIWGLCMAFIYVGCSDNPALSGTIDMNDGWEHMIYVIQPRSMDELSADYGGKVIDSASIDQNGYFEFEQISGATDTMLLELAIQKKGNKFKNFKDNEKVAQSNYMPLLYQSNQSISITADAERFQESLVIDHPSSTNESLFVLKDLRQKAYHQLQKDLAVDHGDYQIIKDEEALHRFQSVLMDFALKAEDIFSMTQAVRWMSPSGDYERVGEVFPKLCNKWASEKYNNLFVTQLCTKAQELPVLVGDQFPDAELPMFNGRNSNISSMYGQRYTVIDIWASWCAPCRVENKKYLRPLWDQYHKRGLNIIAYALDSSDSGWKNAIKKDGADVWHHASHLRGDDAPLMDLLKITTIPANYILDEDGTIIEKNIHGDELIDFFKEKYSE